MENIGLSFSFDDTIPACRGPEALLQKKCSDFEWRENLILVAVEVADSVTIVVVVNVVQIVKTSNIKTDSR